MIFSGGRLSIDLNFTSRSETTVAPDDVLVDLMIALQEPYRGLTFTLERDKDWFSNADGGTAIPLVAHGWNPTGVRIKRSCRTTGHPRNTQSMSRSPATATP